jgi:chromosome segregation ATPase
MKMSLADDIAELEDDYESIKQDCRHLEEQLEDVETQLEDVTNERDGLLAFKTWVELAYPVVVKDYDSVKVIEEVANGL